MFDLPPLDDVIAASLAEDLGVPAEGLLGGAELPGLLAADVTGAAVLATDARFRGTVVARQAGIVCGLPAVQRAWEMLARAAGLSEAIEVFPLVAEGAAVAAGTAVLEVEGSARLVLAGERAALNLLMTLSGIATAAASWQAEAGTALAVVDTRKTLPGLRALSKYAVRVGGAVNHRMGLYDMVLVKDNHIRHAGGIAAAVAAARASFPDLVVEVEADTVAQAREAAIAGADIVLLDNMDDAALTGAVAAVEGAAAESGRQIQTEASGGITFERLAALREARVDRVSSSALTLAPPLDFGLDEMKPAESD
ncbi:MAG: carboxylating nicotinate-nucleotide diphosphorylase [Actinomycetota bacterium]|nr:carboxylating nicotinate-nucleotide diphosphorylase [Actinomycetota bacterium]